MRFFVYEFIAVVVVIKLILQNGPRNVACLNGYCGNGKYDLNLRNMTMRFGVEGASEIWNSHRLSVPEEFRRYQVMRLPIKRSKAARQQLKDNIVHVRLNVQYDISFAEQFKYENIYRYVRNLIYETQLIFEQAEMRTRVRFNLQVVFLGQTHLNFTENLDVEAIHKIISMDPKLINPMGRYDMVVMLVSRNLWSQTQPIILGLAGVGFFCNDLKASSIVINASSIGSAIILAHELGHSFNAMHDGESQVAPCDSEKDIMSPGAGTGRNKWSKCTINQIVAFLSDQKIAGCIFSPARIANTRLIGPEFDFTNIAIRAKLPGREIPIDKQCQLAIGPTARSALNTFNRIDSWETCAVLTCTLNSYLEVEVGPAPVGSECVSHKTKQRGICTADRTCLSV